MNRALLVPGLFCLVWFLPSCQLSLTALAPAHRLNGRETAQAFSEADVRLQDLSLRVLGPRGQVRAQATVVAPNLAVTKASELWDNPLLLESARGSRLTAWKIAEDGSNDLALLRMNGAVPLAASPWSTSDASEGTWVASLDRASDLRVGIVSANARRIERLGGVMGLSVMGLARDSKGKPKDFKVLIAEVFEGSPAAKLGIMAGDQVLEVAGTRVKDPQHMINITSRFDPGMDLPIKLKRANAILPMQVRLGPRSIIEREDKNRRMSGPISRRRGGFSLIFQHDALLRPEAMGGPVVDAQGRLLGVNIARADRVSTYALPTSVVRQSFAKWLR